MRKPRENRGREAAEDRDGSRCAQISTGGATSLHCRRERQRALYHWKTHPEQNRPFGSPSRLTPPDITCSERRFLMIIDCALRARSIFTCRTASLGPRAIEI
jgi:hypothetical protein